MAPVSEFVINHWKGQLPLAVSFWGNLVTIGACVFFIDLLYKEIIEFYALNNYLRKNNFIIDLSLGSFLLICFIWQVVGTFRCSLKNSGKGSKNMAMNIN